MSQSAASHELALAIISPSFAGKPFAIGKNVDTLQVHALVPLAGIVDDSSRPGERWEGIHLLPASELPADAVVINCATSIAPVSAERRVLSVAKKASVVSLCQLQQVAADRLSPSWFIQDMNRDWDEHKAEWHALRAVLADEKSKQVLDDLVRFRRTGSYANMGGYCVRLQEQYFDAACPLAPGDVFVDCGGFDGDTTEQFVQRCPDYKRVWLFEPSEVNMQKAKERLAGVRDINFVPKGVSDKAGTLNFNAGAGSASAIADSGDISIAVTTLDQEIEESVSFVKMDLEGWELKALEGARHHIERDHPKLAIAVYHRASDFWRVPEFIFGIRKDYQVYLRHYTEGWSETVMYFVPRAG
jgi:FkbM family methyltransferase